MQSVNKLTVPNRLIIIEIKYLGPEEDIIEPYFWFIYTFEENSETRFKLWASITINFPISLLKNYEGEYEVSNENHQDNGVAFQGVSYINIPTIPPTNTKYADIDDGINQPINEIGHTVPLFIETLEKQSHFSCIPIVMFETSETASPGSGKALQLSAHKFTTTVTKIKELYRNPLYSCNMLYDIIKFLPTFFEQNFMEKKFEDMTKVSLNKINIKTLKGIKCWNVDAYQSNFLTILKEFVVKNNIHRQRLRKLLADAQKSQHQGKVAMYK